MFDETDTDREKRWFYRQIAGQALRHFRRRHGDGQYFDSRQEALTALLSRIPEGATVGCGDSVTLHQVGIIAALRDRQRNQVFDPFERHEDGNLVMDEGERFRVMREVFTVDVYLSGTNAVTLDGKLVNIDGRGNRVAPMIFGPEKVFIVVGANKIVKNMEEALRHIKDVQAPINAQRHALKHHREMYNDLPCVRTGLCNDCSHKWRICNATVIIEGCRMLDKGRINVFIIGEDLGI